MKNSAFYTPTMARICVEQGNYIKAVEVYRFLLKKEPNRFDLRKALSQVEEKLNMQKGADLRELFSEWLQLVIKADQVEKLKIAKSKLTEK